MPALFSDHTFRHYAYLRDSLSHLVPPLRVNTDTISTIQNLETTGAQDLLNFTIRDLQRLGELQTELAGAADFCATYLRCQLLLMKVGVWTRFGQSPAADPDGPLRTRPVELVKILQTTLRQSGLQFNK
ncbi:hypothetical protein XENOCAPTIV_002028 [Xenoophorus captivus]|uniref:INTS4 8 helical bundle domain-containing protein n=1 Tax=Xenoophorus captivus TaxID=1517983 RepID=A0ABV0RGN7_9TELE